MSTGMSTGMSSESGRRDINYAEDLHAACSIVFLRFDLGNPGIYSWLGLAYGCQSRKGRSHHDLIW